MARKKKELEGIIDRNIFPNKSSFELEGKQYVMKGGIKGQKVRIVTSRNRKDKVESKLLEVLEKSPLETQEPCLAFGICGGCSYQSLDYDTEISMKKEMITRLFDGIYDRDIIINRSPLECGYRNKMEYSFGDKEKGGPLKLGLHSKGRFYEICDTTGCNIVTDDFETIRKNVESYFANLGKTYYRKQTHIGLLRHLIVRYSFSTKEIMVNIVTSTQEQWDVQGFVEFLLSLKLNGRIRTVIHTHNDSLSDAVVPEKTDIAYGDGFIEEKMLGLSFKISPFSFFQPNPNAAEKLYEKALEFAGNIDDKVVFDLYSGTGTIGQVFATKAKRVYGIEIVEEAVEAAKENARLNNLENCEFIAADVLQEIENPREPVNVMVIDPPRDGVHPKAIEKLIVLGAPKIVYISCNPVTQKRDLEIFKENGYAIEEIQLFDQFPRTVHCESIALLSKLDVDNHIDVKIEMDELDITAAKSKATYEEIK